MFIYKSARYHAPFESQYETITEAIEQANYDLEFNEAYPHEIVDEVGAVILSHDELHKKLYEVFEFQYNSDSK